MDTKAIDKLVRLKKEIDKVKSERDIAEGMLRQCLKQLKDEFGCETLEEAHEKLAQMKKKQEEFELKVVQALQEIQEMYNL